MERETSIEIMKDITGFFSEQQRKDIYNACDSWRDRVLIRLLWKTGRRISEVLQVKVQDIDFENGNVAFIILKKNKKYKKWKPLDNFTRELLTAYVKYAQLQPHHYLLHAGYPQKHISRQRAYQIVRRLCKKVGIEKVGEDLPHPHHFRHSFVIDLTKKAKSPAHLRQIQQIMEHSSLAVTEQYMQFGQQDLRELIQDSEVSQASDTSHQEEY
jgi:integrase